MKKRILLLHGWDDQGNSYWIPQLKKILESHGFIVFNPDLPHSHKPVLKEWMSTAKNAVKTFGKGLIIIAYSSGFTLGLQLLTTLKEDEKIDLFIGLAPFDNVLTDDGLTVDLYSIPIDYNHIRDKAASFHLIASDNDPYIPLEKYPKRIQKELNADLKIIHAGLINKVEHYNLIAPIILNWVT